eukprot:TRINITY_DN21496_c0_g1_i1.p1 TRINITY_DN21496_c0_g1~~TRINITY_DN21496_c0_g1_i1.p1  ORF type:complete len:164 (-),score=21.41 TRINITY_DN21496_c0_g1_i1:227-718(-)
MAAKAEIVSTPSENSVPMPGFLASRGGSPQDLERETPHACVTRALLEARCQHLEERLCHRESELRELMESTTQTNCLLELKELEVGILAIQNAQLERRLQFSAPASSSTSPPSTHSSPLRTASSDAPEAAAWVDWSEDDHEEDDLSPFLTLASVRDRLKAMRA